MITQQRLELAGVVIAALTIAVFAGWLIFAHLWSRHRQTPRWTPDELQEGDALIALVHRGHRVYGNVVRPMSHEGPAEPVDMPQMVCDQDELNRLREARGAAAMAKPSVDGGGNFATTWVGQGALAVELGVGLPSPAAGRRALTSWARGGFRPVARASRRDVGAFQFPPRLRGFPYDQERETR